ncbi:putative signal transduction protein [Escherichia coli]|uniref:Putative signal transduction protein n=1 Tax=Escherichia coli TaxID=562 RepID=A0A377C3Y2_ECOLX|nr:putative signal transduction protein [Escherichia coli]
MSLRLVYQDPMGNYFHSLMTTAPLTGAIGFIIVMLFLAVRWLQRQLAGQELLETRATRILNGERGSNVLGTSMNGRPEPAVRWIRCFVKFRTHANNTAVLIR